MVIHNTHAHIQPDLEAHPGLAVEQRNLVESFETYRSYLFSIAYRILGSVMDAEDMVQEAYLRYVTAAPEDLRSLKAYLTTVITRLCIDQLQLAYRKRETYIGPWLPEPILTAGERAPGVEEDAVMKESMSLAFLTLLEQLQPAERAVFILREVFDYDYADIAAFVGKKEAACRQLFSRAKKHLAEERSERPVSTEEQQRLMTAFLQAVRAGDTGNLVSMLSEDVQLVADGGGKVAAAATHPVLGRAAVVQFSMGASRRFLPPRYSLELSEVNRQPAIIGREDGRAIVVLTIEAEEGRIKLLRFMANPEKLARL